MLPADDGVDGTGGGTATAAAGDDSSAVVARAAASAGVAAASTSSVAGAATARFSASVGCHRRMPMAASIRRCRSDQVMERLSALRAAA
jgi:hypothetical protein